MTDAMAALILLDQCLETTQDVMEVAQVCMYVLYVCMYVCMYVL